MASTLYLRDGSSTVGKPMLWGYNRTDTCFSVKDTARQVTIGAHTFTGALVNNLAGFDDDAVGTGLGTAFSTTSVLGPTTGLINTIVFFTPPLAADVTISGTVTYNMCALESSMSANAVIGAALYRVDEQGALTVLSALSFFTTELNTSLRKDTWTATPTSTNMKNGDRIMLAICFDDAPATTMASGFTLTLRTGGSLANVADSNVQFTETLSFYKTEPAGTSFYMNDTASDLGGIVKELATTAGAVSGTAIHTTLTGPLTFPGDQWTISAGGADIEWTTPALDAFTLAGPVRVNITRSSGISINTFNSPFCLTVCELAILDNDGTNAVVWARGFATDDAQAGTTWSEYITGPSTSVAAGKRLRLRIFCDDFLASIGTGGGNQVSGTNRTIRYGNASGAEAVLTFVETIALQGAGPSWDQLDPMGMTGFFGN